MPKYCAKVSLNGTDYSTEPREFDTGIDAQKFWMERIAGFQDPQIITLNFVKPFNCSVVVSSKVLSSSIFIITECID